MSLKERKSKKIHIKMSKLVKTRNPIQCRSHHQKMLAKFGSLENIIEEFRELISDKNTKETSSEQMLSYLTTEPESKEEETLTLQFIIDSDRYMEAERMADCFSDNFFNIS
jgi:hypothetical protein